jgi:uncharacterized protein (TIGR00297 family)
MLASLDQTALILRIVGAAVANLALAGGALRTRSVDASGAVTGFLLGSLIYLGGGLAAWAVLAAFFVSSSLSSRIGKRRKRGLDSLHEKGSRRDGYQAFANAGVGALAMGAYAVVGWPWLIHLFTGSMAVAAADTWSSELGVLSRRAPVSILTFRPVAPGMSGGVSFAGTLASLAGAALMFATSLPLYLSTGGGIGGSGGPGAIGLLQAGAAVIVGGIAGSLIDSVLGAGPQALYRGADGGLTEKSGGAQVKGLAWMNNDAVNFISNAAGSLICLVVARALSAV